MLTTSATCHALAPEAARSAPCGSFQNRLTWGLLLAMAAMSAGLMAERGLRFDWTSGLRPGGACLGLLACAAFYRTWRPDARLAATLVAVAQILAFAAIGAVFSYAVTSLDAPLWSETFLRWDRALGLDWRGLLVAIEARPRLSFVLSLAYKSLSLQFVLCATLLGLTGRLRECRAFVLAVTLAGLATIVLSGVMPAESVAVHLGIRQADFPHVDLSAGFTPLPPFRALRTGALHLVSLRDAEGLISFPSFHTALGVIFACALWSVPWMRWLGLTLNLALIAATPLNGGHYFVDVLAGAAIAAVAITVARGAGRLEKSAVSAK